jgi:hypothetical protein
MGKHRKIHNYKLASQKADTKSLHTSTVQQHRNNRIKSYHKKHSNSLTLSQSTKNKLLPFVTNLSHITLTDAQLLALSKGLKHIPTPNKPDRLHLIKDIDRLQRRMRIAFIMHNKTNKHFNKFRLPSNWNPHDSGNHLLEEYLNNTKSEICHLRFKRPNFNISRIERKALNELSNNPTIVIRKYDKGRGISIINKYDYIQEGLKHLHSHHYELIPFDVTNTSASEINTTLENMYNKDIISYDTFEYLNPLNHNLNCSEMYFLPKLHKIPTGNNKFEVRPIISGMNSATYTISQFLDFFLAPIAASQPTYIKDTTDIIRKLQNLKLPQDALLTAIDIKAMYTNINHNEAITNVCNAYNKSTINFQIQKPPTEYIELLLSLVLKNNTFRFNGFHFKQIVGLAMGSPCSPSVANITIHPLENKFLEQATNIIAFYRFLDDILLISSGPQDELRKQVHTLNTLHPSLKFTADISTTGLNFLDLHIYKGTSFNKTGSLSTKIYTKSCDTFQYISPDSAHPPATFKGFIKGEFLRFIRNCSESHEYELQCQRFTDRLINRGYKPEFIHNIKQSVSHNDRNLLLEHSGEQTIDGPPLVFSTTYTSHLKPKQIKSALTKNWNLISENPLLQSIFKSPPLIAFKRSKNIQDKLVRARIPSDPNIEILCDLMDQ